MNDIEKQRLIAFLEKQASPIQTLTHYAPQIGEFAGKAKKYISGAAKKVDKVLHKNIGGAAEVATTAGPTRARSAKRVRNVANSATTAAPAAAKNPAVENLERLKQHSGEEWNRLKPEVQKRLAGLEEKDKKGVKELYRAKLEHTQKEFSNVAPETREAFRTHSDSVRAGNKELNKRFGQAASKKKMRNFRNTAIGAGVIGVPTAFAVNKIDKTINNQQGQYNGQTFTNNG